MSKALVFQSHTFNIITRDGQTWIPATELSRALGYQRSDKVTQIYQRHSDEFTSSMSQTLKLRFSENLQKEVRVFSLRGCHLIAMFAKTPIAKAFRKWVLDILDAEAAKVQLPAPTLTPAQQRFLQKAVASRTKEIVHREKAFAYIYHHLKDHFKVASYRQIPSERFEEAVNRVERMALPDFEKYTDARITETESAALVQMGEASIQIIEAIRALVPLIVKAARNRPLTALQ